MSATFPPTPPDAPRQCGRIAIVGKPNVGKSTLLNALVGQKISIVSRKAQTTRHRITGIRTVGAAQCIFVDTPGFQTHFHQAIHRTLNKAVTGTVHDVDLVLLVVRAGHFHDEDAKVLSLLDPAIPTMLVANQLDRVHRRAELFPWLSAMQQRADFCDLVPMSATRPKDVERLLHLCCARLPQQDWWYPADALTDHSERFLASETLREKLFRLTGDELPYSSTVVIDTFTEAGTAPRKVRIAATIVVDRESHKGIVIGDRGERIKAIGTQARIELERLLDAKVFLETWVTVRSGWADDEARVRSFGYE
ncbi:GTPase Era [Candidatus Symbiobacter mobilis]|uniref:GTPase Era n=1 Tax=Candidatus Symbiobacter mobilis CR TaxID=946483 RepID=U5NEC3_9BURK|nr:GTPase Era [Candidatus Symbiobacter mobilis]AGX88578.1 GTP-binding protein Era [Candidatus Symbiobacter mobilis CR]